MVSTTEKIFASSLRAILAELPVGAEIPDSDQFRESLEGLNWYVPEILYEFDLKGAFALDGICSARARKTGDTEAEILGVCWTLPDCSPEPIQVWLKIGEPKDEVCWLLCYFGEKYQRERKGRPPRSMHSWLNRMHRYAFLEAREHVIDWAYKVKFGDRGPSNGE